VLRAYLCRVVSQAYRTFEAVLQADPEDSTALLNMAAMRQVGACVTCLVVQVRDDAYWPSFAYSKVLM
jgi:hypothetical protein